MSRTKFILHCLSREVCIVALAGLHLGWIPPTGFLYAWSVVVSVAAGVSIALGTVTLVVMAANR